MQEKLNPYLTVEDGQKIPLPRYYKEKAFNDEQKANLALKAKEYLEENTIFASDLEKREYLKAQIRKRDKDIHTKRRKI